MFDSSAGAKLPLDLPEIHAIQRLGRWIRVVGTIQIAGSGMFLLVMLLGLSCGFMAGFSTALLIPLVLIALASVALLQGLRIQAAGEQFKNLAEDPDVDYLEIAFARLKTVFTIDVIIGVLIAIFLLGGQL